MKFYPVLVPVSASFCELLIMLQEVKRIIFRKLQQLCYIVGLGPNCKFIDLLFKRSFIKFIEISLYLDFIVSEIICKQTDTLNQGLIHQRQF